MPLSFIIVFAVFVLFICRISLYSSFYSLIIVSPFLLLPYSFITGHHRFFAIILSFIILYRFAVDSVAIQHCHLLWLSHSLPSSFDSFLHCYHSLFVCFCRRLFCLSLPLPFLPFIQIPFISSFIYCRRFAVHSSHLPFCHLHAVPSFINIQLSFAPSGAIHSLSFGYFLFIHLSSVVSFTAVICRFIHVLFIVSAIIRAVFRFRFIHRICRAVLYRHQIHRLSVSFILIIQSSSLYAVFIVAFTIAINRSSFQFIIYSFYQSLSNCHHHRFTYYYHCTVYSITAVCFILSITVSFRFILSPFRLSHLPPFIIIAVSGCCFDYHIITVSVAVRRFAAPAPFHYQVTVIWILCHSFIRFIIIIICRHHSCLAVHSRSFIRQPPPSLSFISFARLSSFIQPFVPLPFVIHRRLSCISPFCRIIIRLRFILHSFHSSDCRAVSNRHCRRCLIILHSLITSHLAVTLSLHLPFVFAVVQPFTFHIHLLSALPFHIIITFNC